MHVSLTSLNSFSFILHCSITSNKAFVNALESLGPTSVNFSSIVFSNFLFRLSDKTDCSLVTNPINLEKSEKSCPAFSILSLLIFKFSCPKYLSSSIFFPFFLFLEKFHSVQEVLKLPYNLLLNWEVRWIVYLKLSFLF